MFFRECFYYNFFWRFRKVTPIREGLKYKNPMALRRHWVLHILMHIVSNVICITLYYVILWCIFRIWFVTRSLSINGEKIPTTTLKLHFLTVRYVNQENELNDSFNFQSSTFPKNILVSDVPTNLCAGDGAHDNIRETETCPKNVIESLSFWWASFSYITHKIVILHFLSSLKTVSRLAQFSIST